MARISDKYRVFDIGRGPKNDIRVDHDEYVSPRHCQLYLFDRMGFVGVRDLGSMNGTWVVPAKGPTERVRTEALLGAGDRLRLGMRTYVPWEQLWLHSADNFAVERLPEQQWPSL